MVINWFFISFKENPSQLIKLNLLGRYHCVTSLICYHNALQKFDIDKVYWYCMYWQFKIFLKYSVSCLILCFRHVSVPRKYAKLIPQNHLMTETEWRNLGIQQSPGWKHYLIHTPGLFSYFSVYDLYMISIWNAVKLVRAC